MTTPALKPEEAARWAERSGLALPSDRHQSVAETAQHIYTVVSVLRELDFGDVPPAATYQVNPWCGDQREGDS
ncbi:hypothetical protein [Brevibacterium aurantiacum]|uniref:Amidase n=1 Tax=Brevibacterium aurantiacum TaxID=273384 RepID=A0A2A3Z2V1_BREAU|nr:hypothetical protein [Brevibacterium aurantiacum]PCC45848.1 hypothetical protein CIK64_14080 [Brevibacterium aurantiacum]